jgi:hypothetical protein
LKEISEFFWFYLFRLCKRNVYLMFVPQYQLLLNKIFFFYWCLFHFAEIFRKFGIS